jgi:serine phosphatase RsbU (regulator of sigma subunit)
VIQCPAEQTRTVPLAGTWISIGRSDAATICFPEDTELSRQHCGFEFDGTEWSIRDLASRNGTFVNNALLTFPHRLQPGDRIAAGNLFMVFEPEVDFNDAATTPSKPRATAARPPDPVTWSPKGVRPEQTLVLQSSPLEAVLRAGRELSEHQPLTELISVILDLALLSVSAQRGALLLLEGDRLVTKVSRGEPFCVSSTIRDRVIRNQLSVLVRDAQRDEVLRSRRSILDYGVRTVIAVPLRAGDHVIGLLYVDSPAVVREFTEDDLRLLTVMANVASARIEQARLTEVEQAERKLLEEVEQAAEIQRCVLPDRALAIPGFDIAGFNLPCRTVGGDYYGFFALAEGRLGVALGDVSGKGMPAALMMMALDARVQVLIEDSPDLSDFMGRLNRATCNRYPSNRFITLVACAMDPDTGEVRCANAGHCAPIVVRAAGETETIEESSLVLGILPDERYRETRLYLGEDDLLVLYSDGITESSDDEFSPERLASVLSEHRHAPAAAIVDAVTTEVVRFAGSTRLPDDVTLVVAKRIGKPL